MAKKNIKNKLINLTIFTSAVLVGAFIPTVAKEIYTQAQINDPRFDDVIDYMQTTDSGVPLTLPLNDNPIAIVFENMSDKEKELAKDAIKALDDISENINYTILDNDDCKISQKIIIRSDTTLSDELAGGKATYTFNNFTGEINYPVYVSLDPDFMYYVSSISGESMYTTIVKHEMMHTLGFKDIYDENDKYNTIMYYLIANDDRALGYTEFDAKNIRQVYDEGKVKVSTPTEASVAVELEQKILYNDTTANKTLPENKYTNQKHLVNSYYIKKEDDDYSY